MKKMYSFSVFYWDGRLTIRACALGALATQVSRFAFFMEVKLVSGSSLNIMSTVTGRTVSLDKRSKQLLVQSQTI